MEDQKNKNLPPKIDAQKMEAQLQEEKKKEEAFNKKQKQKRWLLVGGIIGIMVVAVVCFGLFISRVTYSLSESIVNNIPGEEEFHDPSYRLLNAPGEYIANEQLSIVEDLEDQDKIGLIKKGESFWCEDTAYVDSKEELWGQLGIGWVLLRDQNGNYATENVLTSVDSTPGTAEVLKDIRVYSDPSTKSAILKSLKKGDQVEIVSEKEDINGVEWFELEDGWILKKDNAKRIESSQEETKEEKESKETDEIPEDEEGIRYKAKYDMKIREEPSLEAERTGTVKLDEVVEIVEIGEDEKGATWGKIRDGDYVCLKDKDYTYFEEVSD